MFTSYYVDTHSGRKLVWQTNMGTAEVRACVCVWEGVLGGLRMPAGRCTCKRKEPQGVRLVRRGVSAALTWPPWTRARCVRS